MDDVIAAAKFLITGSTFQSSIPLADLTPVANTPHQSPQDPTPYCLFQRALSQLPLFHLSIHPLLLRLKPMLLFALHFCAAFAEIQGTLLITAPAFMNTSMQEWFLEAPMVDSTCQTDHPFCMHLEDGTIRMELTMGWHHSNLLHSLPLLPHPHQLLQGLQGIHPPTL